MLFSSWFRENGFFSVHYFINNIYLSLRTQVAEETIFRKQTLLDVSLNVFFPLHNNKLFFFSSRTTKRVVYLFHLLFIFLYKSIGFPENYL